MSHLSCAKTVVEDLDCVDETFKKLPIPERWKEDYGSKIDQAQIKVEFLRDQKQFTWYGGRFNACDHAARITFPHGSTYEIGLVPKKGGGWELQYDSGLIEWLGDGASRFMALYTEEVCEKYARETGAMIEKSELEGGKVRIAMGQPGSSKKVIAIVDPKTGNNTITCEGGEGGGVCLTDTSKLEEMLGIKDPQREMLPEYYNKVQQKEDNQVGGA